MTEDLANKLPETAGEKLTLILTTVQSLTVRADNIDSRLGRVEQTVHDTRPILQKVVEDISQLQEGQRQLQEGQRQLQEGQRQLQEGQRQLREGQRQLQEGQTEIRADVLKLKEGQTALTAEVRAIRRDVDHRFDLIYDKLVETERDHCDLHNRVTRLELNQNPPNAQT